MSFLFEDDVLAKLLVQSGVFENINKYGQQVNNEAKLVAVKLAKSLLEQANDLSGGNDLQIYVQNLVDLDAYLNFLVKNGVKDAAGKFIALHDASGASPPPAEDNYTKYKEFYVLKDAFLGKLRELDDAASQAGNEVIKPLVKNLIEEVNSAFDVKFENQKTNPDGSSATNEQLPNLPPGQTGSGQAGGTNSVPGNQTGQGNLQNVSYHPNDPNAQNVLDQNGNEANSKAALEKLMSSLPFETADSLSPFAMQAFIYSAAALADAEAVKLKDNRLIVELAQFASSIDATVGEWSGFVHSAPIGGVGGANASAYETVVPYDRANRPFSTLESIFGSQFKAKEACQRLLQMVLLVQQTIASIKRSPMLFNKIGSNVLDYQARQAKAFTDSLTPYTR